MEYPWLGLLQRTLFGQGVETNAGQNNKEIEKLEREEEKLEKVE